LIDVQAGLVEQAQIEENIVRQNGTNPLKPLGAGASHCDPVSGAGEHLAHKLRDLCRVIIDGQQVGHSSPWCSSRQVNISKGPIRHF